MAEAAMGFRGFGQHLILPQPYQPIESRRQHRRLVVEARNQPDNIAVIESRIQDSGGAWRPSITLPIGSPRVHDAVDLWSAAI